MRHLAVDTETTGFGPLEHRIIEVAVVPFDPVSGQHEPGFHTLVNPQRPIPAEATAVHGIGDTDVAGAPTFAEVCEALCATLQDGVAVIHNAPFDIGFLDAELLRCKARPLRAVTRDIVDTLPLARRVLPRRRHTLDALCDHYGIDRTARVSHGATLDCQLLAQVYPRLCQDSARVATVLGALLARPLEAPLTDDVADLVHGYLAVAGLQSVLETEGKRLRGRIAELVQGEAYEGDDFAIRHVARTLTDWTKVHRQLLPEVDLTPFQKASSSMYIEHRSS